MSNLFSYKTLLIATFSCSLRPRNLFFKEFEIVLFFDLFGFSFPLSFSDFLLNIYLDYPITHCTSKSLISPSLALVYQCHFSSNSYYLYIWYVRVPFVLLFFFVAYQSLITSRRNFLTRWSKLQNYNLLHNLVLPFWTSIFQNFADKYIC